MIPMVDEHICDGDFVVVNERDGATNWRRDGNADRGESATVVLSELDGQLQPANQERCYRSTCTRTIWQFKEW